MSTVILLLNAHWFTFGSCEKVDLDAQCIQHCTEMIVFLNRDYCYLKNEDSR